MRLNLLVKTTRMNFLPASLIPFFTGVALAVQKGYGIETAKLFFGVVGVASAHLAGNVVNELYDHKSGADLNDDRRSPFFGGSKAIKDGLVTSREVLRIAVILISIAFVCGLAIFIITRDPVIIFMMTVAGILTVGYTAPPIKLSYRRLGELNIFMLFGLLLVTGSYYLFSGVFSLDSFILSLPVSFLIVGVILCNEVPDINADRKAGKLNLMSLVDEHAGYMLYMTVILLSFLSVIINVGRGIVSPFAVVLVVLYVLGVKAALIIKHSYYDFKELIKASGMTILLHTLIGTGIIAATLLK